MLIIESLRGLESSVSPSTLEKSQAYHVPDFEMLLAFAQKNGDMQLKEQLVFLDMFAKLLVVVSQLALILARGLDKAEVPVILSETGLPALKTCRLHLKHVTDVWTKRSGLVQWHTCFKLNADTHSTHIDTLDGRILSEPVASNLIA